MKKNLGKDETLLKGEDMLAQGKHNSGEVTKRIDYLTGNVLTKVATREGGWIILYRDDSDGRYWELFYPEYSDRDSGPPSLRNISEAKAKEKYKI